MKSPLVKIITLTLLVFTALFLRVYQLYSLPPALFSDEVDIANQVKSFRSFQTDYYGNPYPIHFHSFSDWRTPLQIYSSVLVSFFTSDPILIVRLPSVLFSVLTIIVFYLLTNSFLAALLLTLSPWSIHFGRSGFEVSGMLFCLLTGTYLWLKFIKKPRILFLILSLLFLCLSPYFYSTAKLFIVFLVPLLLLIWSKTLKNISPKSLLILSLFGLLFLSPLIIDTVRSRAGFRFSYISIFTEPHREQITDTLRYQDILLSHPGEIGVKTPLLSYILHNKLELVMEKFIGNFISSFSTTFLFLQGDSNLRQGFGSHGLLYLIDFLFIFIGLVIYFKKPDKLGTFFLIFLIFSPIPFSLTRDSATPHATRLIFMLLPLLYFSSLALKKYLIFLPFYLISFLLFWHQYTIHYPQLSARFWHYNLKEAVLAAKTISTTNPVYFSDSYEPFLPFFLLYFPYTNPVNDPNLVRNIQPIDNSLISGQVIDNHYFFGHVNWDQAPTSSDSLFVLPQSQFENLSNRSSFKIITKIDKYYLSAEAFYLVTPL